MPIPIPFGGLDRIYNKTNASSVGGSDGDNNSFLHMFLNALKIAKQKPPDDPNAAFNEAVKFGYRPNPYPMYTNNLPFGGENPASAAKMVSAGNRSTPSISNGSSTGKSSANNKTSGSGKGFGSKLKSNVKSATEAKSNLLFAKEGATKQAGGGGGGGGGGNSNYKGGSMGFSWGQGIERTSDKDLNKNYNSTIFGEPGNEPSTKFTGPSEQPNYELQHTGGAQPEWKPKDTMAKGELTTRMPIGMTAKNYSTAEGQAALDRSGFITPASEPTSDTSITKTSSDANIFNPGSQAVANAIGGDEFTMNPDGTIEPKKKKKFGAIDIEGGT